MDICTTIVLESDYTIEAILIEAGESATQPYERRPLDFVCDDDWAATLVWKMNVNILQRLHAVRQRCKTLPEQRISSFNFPKLSRTAAVVALCVALAYGAIFFGAWNLQFPSSVEHRLWQISTSITIGITFIAGTMEILSIRQDGNSDSEETYRAEGEAKKSGILPTFRHAELQSNKAIVKQPQSKPSYRHFALGIPLRSLLVTQPICAIYTICRIYVIVEDLIGLRALPASSFQNVNWTAYWPHI